MSAYDNLVHILQTGKIFGSSSRQGFIKGATKAACFMDVPFAALKYVLTPENSAGEDPRYEPFGVFVTKKYAYKKGCRPVLYLSNDETERLKIPSNERWRVVRLEVEEDDWISWLHEREWRCPGQFALPHSMTGVLVRTTNDAVKLTKDLADDPKAFACTPRCILPAEVICQGLIKP